MLLNNLVAELSLLQGLSHDSLLTYHGSALLAPPLPQPGTILPFEPTTSCVAMVTEVARNGDLETAIARAARARQQDLQLFEDGLPWALRVRCCAEVASALDFIHCQDVSFDTPCLLLPLLHVCCRSCIEISKLQTFYWMQISMPRYTLYSLSSLSSLLHVCVFRYVTSDLLLAPSPP